MKKPLKVAESSCKRRCINTPSQNRAAMNGKNNINNIMSFDIRIRNNADEYI